MKRLIYTLGALALLLAASACSHLPPEQQQQRLELFGAIAQGFGKGVGQGLVTGGMGSK